ncbi:MAG: hypothetical protein PHU50_02125 [Kiritimatiellae bacterium]|nr:hypothetical protein [Kiritimatiellia bacterium]
MKALPLRFWLSVLHAAAAILVAGLFFLYPAAVIGRLALESRLRRHGESAQVPRWFEAAADRYHAWAADFLESQVAQSLHHDDVAATEWPLFGSVFFLVTADDLHARGQIDAASGTLREAVEKAAEIVASPVTATWVRTKWGETYLDRENVFYRMLLILGLSSYETITGDQRHRPLMSAQRQSLAQELAAAPLHLLDDYPGECYPSDLLWAAAAIQRAARMEGEHHDELAAGLMAAFDGPVRAREGLPAFQVDSSTGRILQHSRGCGNSGILLFAFELDPAIAARWVRAYETHFWKDTGWIAGFAEMPHGTQTGFQDVDSGPVLFGLGSVASAFGIGTARSAGRLDLAVPLTLEAVACAWPSPFGFLVPALLGKAAADSACLGEIALLFSMTRPVRSPEIVPFSGRIPGIVWLLLAAYAGLGLAIIASEIRRCRRLYRTARPRTGPLS